MNPILPSSCTEKPRFTNWWRLLVGMSITLILSLSVHAVMLQVIHVPVPPQDVKSWIPFRLVTDMAVAGGLIILYKLVAGSRHHKKKPYIALITFLTVCGLNETLRGWAMDAYCSEPFASSAFLLSLMTIASSLYYGLALLVVAIASPRIRTLTHYVLVSVATGVILTFLAPLLIGKIQSFFSSVFESMAPHHGWCVLPYGANVLIPAYLSFIEPVIAAVFCAAITWQFLKGGIVIKLAQFTLLILALKQQLFASFLYAIYAKTGFWLALASMGQFTLEAAVLGMLAALTWVWSKKTIPEKSLGSN